MQDARTASLIHRWLAGGKLTDEEKIEVHKQADIPLDVLSVEPSSPSAKEAVSKLKSTRKHARYPKKLPEYAAVFGQTDRTVKRWIKRGKETGELPPLDHPPHMAAWWRRNMDNQVPDYLIGFIGQSSPDSPDPRAGNGETGSTEGQPGGTSRSPRDFSQIEGLDLEKNVEELRRSHAINKHLLDEALHAKEPSEQGIALRQRNYERSFELLRKSERTLLEFKQLSGGLINPEPIRAELAQVLESLRLMRETMTDRILTELEKILPRRFQRVLRLFEKFLRPAIEKTRADEENIFRNLGALDGPDAVKSRLAA
ncbi:MAG TPA: hypothetical protein VGM62_20115 [Chthoniobacterales bacterium]